MQTANRGVRGIFPASAGRRLLAACLAGACLIGPAASGADLPDPIVSLPFSEGGGDATANEGLLGGAAAFAVRDGLPVFTDQVPSGPFAPSDNPFALDLGTIAAGQGGRAVDLTTDGDGTLGALGAFTICGWLNCRDLNEGWGGNRIAFALAWSNGPGLDLVQLASGALRIGINQWPDDDRNGGGPMSSPGRIGADPAAGPGNWVFFAVTYDSTLLSGQLKYYFGSPDVPAGLDGEYDYVGAGATPSIESSGMLTLGNFGAVVDARNDPGPDGLSRVFRGLMDEIEVFDIPLSLEEIQAAQAGGQAPEGPIEIVQGPGSISVFEGQQVVLKVLATGSAPIAYQWRRDGEDISGAIEATYTFVASLADDGIAFRVKLSNAVTPEKLSDEAILTVRADEGPRVSLSFSESDAVTNRGHLGGTLAYVRRDGYPASSSSVPEGTYVPADNIASADFGTIAAGQGGRAGDLTAGGDGTLGPMGGFTICGWLNCRDLREGGGGNRIAFALTGDNGQGFDLVQLADGSLQVGINGWPDLSPARSSMSRIPQDAAAGPENWVFFAVTYDASAASGSASFYFGGPEIPADLDVSIDVAGGAIERTGPLTVGNFGATIAAREDPGAGLPGSRCFRGLIDEIDVFGKPLGLEEIREVQIRPAWSPVVVDPAEISLDPVSVTVTEGGPAAFDVEVTGTPPITYQWWTSHEGIETEVPGAMGPHLLIRAAALEASGDEFWVVVENSEGTATSARATLTVLPDQPLKVYLPFSEEAGSLTANFGVLGGEGTFADLDGWPVFSPEVPAGAFAPPENFSSVDFGPIEDFQGGRAIDFTNPGDGTLGAMGAFTVTGWLNCRDLRCGPGGNRLVFALASPGGPGFDLVQNADGSLQLGVNQWPDNTPARSSPGRITESLDGAPENWVFFAVTYDASLETAQAKFYFGGPEAEAAFDIEATYGQGPIVQSGALTIGNFGPVDGARGALGPFESRCFRGLVDEVRIFSRDLDLAEIAAVQIAGVQSPPTGLEATPGDGTVVLDWDEAAGALGYDIYRDNVKLNGAPISESRYEDGGLANGVRYCYRVSIVTGAGEGPLSAEACATPEGGAQEPRFLRGDADGSGMIDLTDAIFTLQFLFMGGTPPECLDASDTDDSGAMDLTDAVFSLQFQFMGGEEPKDPGPRTCGIDPNPDSLPGCVFPMCPP